MRRQWICLLFLVVLTVASVLFASVVRADGFVGLGGRIVHGNGFAFHFSAPVYDALELHYSMWEDGEHDHALGIGYRFGSGGALSVLVGVAYVGTVTENLLRHEDAYIEVRYRFYRSLACQIGHYSSVGDDKGENFLICGYHWGG